ncbi:MAG TPA: adenylate/guanylate cyclase domain-containing protein [Candidatus Dormibacteraeota bacterium]|nr:adenylate/guanylate cyclase domain-containing protein [Candidatus Dormibacteraeota bacterium]
MIPPPVGRYIRYWYTYRTVVAVVLALVLSGAIYWLYVQQANCDAGTSGCLVKIAVHPEDRLFANQTDPGPGVVIVGIDNRSAQAIGTYPFPRSVYATALKNLEQDGATVVGFDIEFADHRDPVTDGIFARALAASTIPVVLSYPASDLQVRQGKLVQTGPPAGIDQIPLKEFRCQDTSPDASVPCQKPDPNVILASPDFVLDADGVVRRVPIFVQPACYSAGTCATPLIDTFGFAAFRASQPDFKTFPEPQPSGATASVGTGFNISVDSTGSALINFSGPPGNFVHYKRYVSLAEVMSGAAPAGMFKGNIVLVGAYALSGVNDEQLVTTSAGGNGTISMAGVEILANVARMMSGAPSTLLTPEPAWLLFVLILVLGLATAVGVARVSVLWGLLGTVLALGVFTFGMAGLASFYNFVPDVFHPWLAIALTYSGVTAYRFLYEDREKRKVTAIFGQYLKPEIVAQLAKTRRGVEDIMRGGERRDITLLFVDIRGFTSMSESMAPPDVTELVTTYLDLLSGLIFKWDGTVDKYVGDEIMAFWNAPRQQENHALLAVRCAYDLINHAPELEQMLLAKGLPPIRWGIGINSGPAVVGNMGSRSRIQYTALGDTVNTAARFCAHAPAFHVLIGEETYQMCKDYIAVDLVPGVQLKGKSAETFRIYQLTAIRENPTSPWVPFPTEMATRVHHDYTSQYTQQTVIAAGESGSRDILVGEAAEQAMAREGISPN